jgi:hypothetical protein
VEAPNPVNVRFTTHADLVMQERGILRDWVDDTLEHPERREVAADATIHYFRRIPAFGGRWLHVVLNEAAEPPLVVTLFFDRRVQ